MNDAPIAIFDSGVGGLTVFREIADQMPGESLIYLGDSARVPYGTKSVDTITRYTEQAARFLLRFDVKLLVIACNTASAAALPQIGNSLGVPIVGVIEPGAAAAAKVARDKVGVIATEGTIRSGAYRTAIHQTRPSLRVFEAACPLFVALAEEGWANTRVAREVAEIYLKPLMDDQIDTLVLGCTHYPILRATIEAVVGDQVTIVDSAETTAAHVAAMLPSGQRAGSSGTGRRTYFVTDAAERFRRIAGEFLECDVEELELVDIAG